MIKCPDCGNVISDLATSCPKCGRPATPNNDNYSYTSQAPSQSSTNVIPPMGIIDAVKVCLQEKYACFEGRAKRTEYWYFYLATLFISIPISFVFLLAVLFMSKLLHEGNEVTILLTVGIVGIGILLLLLFLALLIPSIAVAVRRLHDSGKSGLLLLLTLIPYIGGIIVFVFYLLPSEPKDNKYGPYQVHAV